MASGSSNQKQANKAQKNAIAALQPKSYEDPFGSFSGGVYKPNITPEIQGSINNYNKAINSISGQIPTSFNVEDMYNNPFYSTMADEYKAPVNRQYEQDSNDLTANLGAKNQLGSSYDALMRKNLQQQRDFQLNQADDQARLGSANAYQQQFTNGLNALNTANNAKTQTMQQLYMPFNAYQGYQGAVSPLQTGMANVYSNAMAQYLSRPTNSQQLFNLGNSAIGAAGQVAAAAIPFLL